MLQIHLHGGGLTETEARVLTQPLETERDEPLSVPCPGVGSCAVKPPSVSPNFPPPPSLSPALFATLAREGFGVQCEPTLSPTPGPVGAAG